MLLPHLTQEETIMLLSFTIPYPPLSGFVWKPQRIIQHSYQHLRDPVMTKLYTAGAYQRACMNMINGLQKFTDYILDEEGTLLSYSGVIKLLCSMGEHGTRMFSVFSRVQRHVDRMVTEKMAPWILMRKELDTDGLSQQMIQSLAVMEYLYLLSYDLNQSYSTDVGKRSVAATTPPTSPPRPPVTTAKLVR